jgi:hypothetical protein
MWKGSEDQTLRYQIGVSTKLFEGTQIIKEGTIFCGLGDRDQRADFLRFSSSRVYFNKGESVNPNRAIYLSPTEGINEHFILVSIYSWEREAFYQTNILYNADITPGKTEVYIGFRDYRASQPHYGWAHLRRASTNAGVAYVMVDWAVNPFPGQAIRAGEPPDLPPLSTVVDTTTDPANPTLRVSWPAGFPGVKLQTTGDLTPPVQWLDQELDAERLAVVTLPPEGTLFFRLVWAGP